MPGEREAATEQATPEVVAGPGLAEAQPALVERVLMLQRSAGNAAVTRMLARLKTGPHEWKDPKLSELLENDHDDGDFYRYTHDNLDDRGGSRLAEIKQARWEFKGEQNKLDPDNPAHKAAFEAWRKKIQKIDDVVLHEAMWDAQQSAPLDDAPEGGWKKGQRPERLTSKTHDLSDAERDKVRDVMLPGGKAGSIGDFKSKLDPAATDTWESKITKALNDLVDDMYGGLVKDKDDADRKDENLTDWSRYHEIADVAKEETDRVFGSYNRGPAMRHGNGLHGGNLWDRWEVKKDEMQQAKGESDTHYDQAKTEYAMELAKYHLASSKAVGRINIAHNADLERTSLSPGEKEAEATIVARVLKDLVARRREDLIKIDRGWRGGARGSNVLIQRWRSKDPKERRNTWWYTFQMMVHEYLHTLTHAGYVKFADKQSGLARHMWIEGVTSLFTEIVWANIGYRYWTGTLPQRVEGSDYVGDAETKAAVAANMPWPRYGAYEQALAVMEAVGSHNMYAAYFLGETEYIRPTGVKK